MPNAVRRPNSPDIAVSPRAYLTPRDATEDSHIVLRQFPAPDVEQAWQDFLERVEFPDLYVTPHYFLEPHWKGKNPFAILAVNAGRVTGVLTGIVIKEQVICGLASRPQLLVEPGEMMSQSAATLAKALISEFPQSRLTSAFSWSSAFAPAFEEHGFRVRQLQGDVVLDLRPGADAVYRSFHDNRKRNIRASIRRGVEVSEVTTDQDFADYWTIHCLWRNTDRKTIHVDATFEKAAQVHQLRATHRRFLARHEGKAIAATSLRFYPGGLIEYAANCSMDEFNHLRPNDLLIWKTIQWACEQGFSRYSLGGAHPFLTKCGGVIFPIYRYRLDRTFLHRVERQQKAEEVGRLLRRHFQASKSAAKQFLKEIFAPSGSPPSTQT